MQNEKMEVSDRYYNEIIIKMLECFRRKKIIFDFNNIQDKSSFIYNNLSVGEFKDIIMQINRLEL